MSREYNMTFSDIRRLPDLVEFEIEGITWGTVYYWNGNILVNKSSDGRISETCLKDFGSVTFRLYEPVAKIPDKIKPLTLQHYNNSIARVAYDKINEIIDYLLKAQYERDKGEGR